MSRRPVEKWDAAGLCTNCGRTRDGEQKQCSTCRARSKKNRDRRTAQVLCRMCNRNPREYGTPRCHSCAEACRQFKKRRSRLRPVEGVVARAAVDFVTASLAIQNLSSSDAGVMLRARDDLRRATRRLFKSAKRLQEYEARIRTSAPKKEPGRAPAPTAIQELMNS